jgi:hypothetical protein
MCRYDYVDGVRRNDEDLEEALRMPSRPSLIDTALRLSEEEQRRREEEQRRQEASQRWHEEYEEQYCYDDHDYTFYQDLNREFAGNYQQAVDEAARIWKDFACLDQTAQDDIYEKLNQAMSDKFYIYRQLRNDIQSNEDGIMRIFDSSFDVCRVVYLSKIIRCIISQPDDLEAVEQLRQFEQWVDEELDNSW